VPDDEDDPFADAWTHPDLFQPEAPEHAERLAMWEDAPGDAVVEDSAAWGTGQAEATSPTSSWPTPPPAPPPPPLPTVRPLGFAERERLLLAIGERARELRMRRRTTSLGIMGTALVLLLIVTALRLGGGDSTLTAGSTSTTGALVGVTGPDEIAPATFATAPTVPLPSLAPLTLPPSTTTTPRATTSRGSTTTFDLRPPGDRTDAKPGWFNATDRCDEAFRLPVDAGPPAAALSLELTVDGTSVRSGNSLAITLTIVNKGDSAVTVFYRTPASHTDAWILASRDQAASLTMTQGQEKREFVVVPPKAVEPGKVTMSRTVRASRCGDTSSDLPPGLASSTYLVGASLEVALTINGPLQAWRSPQEQVTVTG
jgi:hypothetical protein